MSLEIVIKPKIVKFDRSKLKEWMNNHRNGIGFAESVVMEHLEGFGYKCIQHDYSMLGCNKLGKYPESEEILKRYFGIEKYKAARKFSSITRPFRTPGKETFEEPDMLVYKPDLSELKFVEVKRSDTRDRLRKKQVRGLLLLASLLNADVEVFIVVPNDVEYENKEIVWEFPTDIVDWYVF